MVKLDHASVVSDIQVPEAAVIYLSTEIRWKKKKKKQSITNNMTNKTEENEETKQNKQHDINLWVDFLK